MDRFSPLFYEYTMEATGEVMKAIWNGQLLAESSDTILVEGNHYFPINAINSEYFKPSDYRTTCIWKGKASYYSIEVDGHINPDSAWFYPEPKKRAANIKDRVAFWKGIEVLEH